MKRLGFLVTSLLVVLSSLTVISAQAATQPAVGAAAVVVEWHRLNPDQSNLAPNHERLTCSQLGQHWSCAYFLDAEPGLNFDWDSTVGQFAGHDVTESWICPTWLPDSVCQNVTAVVQGKFKFTFADGSRFSTRAELVVSGTGSDRTLYLDFVEFGFACPWYLTFADALEANPFPLPFDGVNWPANDCVSAP
jgi:hypothetical protein